MPLNEDKLFSELSMPKMLEHYDTIQLYATALGIAYQNYALECQTGVAPSVALVTPATLVPTSLSNPFNTLTTAATSEMCAKAFALGIKSYWLTAAFVTPPSVTASILLPPTELLVKLPKDRAIEASSKSISEYVDVIVKDLGSMPAVMVTAAAGASSGAISTASQSMQTNIDVVSASMGMITTALGNIPATVSGTSDMPKIGSAFSDIGSGVSSAVSALAELTTTITGFPSVLGSAVAAEVSKALDPITKDIKAQFDNITASVSAGVANMTAASEQRVSLETALVKGLLCNTNKLHLDQVKVLAKILHACTKTGTTSIVNMSTGVAVYSLGVLGDIADVAGIDLT